MKRKDGRDFLSYRKIRVEFNSVDSSNGSCKLTLGGTCVIANVIGPCETSPLFQHPTKCTIKVDFKSPYFSKKENQYSGIFLKSCFEKFVCVKLYPLKRIYMSVNVLSDEGGTLSVALNALMYASMVSGVNLKACILSVSIGITNTKEIYIDPTESENDMKKGTFVLNSNDSTPGLVGVYCGNGSKAYESEEDFIVSLAAAREAVKKLKKFLRASLTV